jgi:hypothetical protein
MLCQHCIVSQPFTWQAGRLNKQGCLIIKIAIYNKTGLYPFGAVETSIKKEPLKEQKRLKFLVAFYIQ